MSRPEQQLYEFGPFRLNAREQMLLCDGQPVPLTPKVFDTLLVLVSHHGRLLEKDELMQEIWPGQFVEEINLTVNISALRKVLGESQGGPRFIETIPKRGYRFIAPVRAVLDEDGDLLLVKRTRARISIKEEEEEQLEEEETETAEGSRQKTESNIGSLPFVLRFPLSKIRAASPRQQIAASVTFAAALLICAAAVSSYLRTRKTTAEIAPIVAVRSIAVLPFKPMIASEESDEYLGMGMADNLIYRLGHLKQITVRPTTAILKYTAATQNPVTVGRELNVDAIVDGRIKKSGDRVWVTAQLVRVSDGVPLWTEKFDEKFDDVFAVQDRIAEHVVFGLVQALTPREKQLLNKRGTQNTVAYEAYIKGRYFWNKRSAEGYLKAYDYFQQAISLDPKYAPAYAGIADSYLLGGAGLPTGMELDAPKVYAMKALEIDDMLAEAHTSLAYAKSAIDWDWQSADTEFRRAIEINPSYLTAHHWYAYHLVSLGRIDEAIAEIKRAQEIDPTSLIINTDVGHILYFARRYDEAIAQYLKVLEMDPDFRVAHWRLGEAYERKGLYSKAIAELRESLERSSDAGALTWLGHACAVSGQKDEALKIIAQLKSRPKDYAYDLALIYTGLEEKDQAFAWLQKAFDTRDGGMAVIQAEPMLDDLRSDHRYMELLRRMKLRA